MFFKRNKFIILSFLIMIVIMLMSFYQFFDSHFSYAKGYYVIKENCYEEKNVNHEYCSRFIDRETLEQYIISSNPIKNYKKLDAITVTCEVVEVTIFSVLQFVSPLLILIALIGTIQSEFSSGMFKNYLTRMSYKSYLKRIFKRVLIISLMTPLLLLITFVISACVTRFNFNIADGVELSAFYEPWKYSHFFIYGLVVFVIQYLVNILYCNIGLFCCLKNKNSLVATFMGYITFLLVEIFVYVVIYVYIINKLLGFRGLTDYFNIAGYWFFDSGKSCAYIILIAFLLMLISAIIVFKLYGNKEKVIIAHEKQDS